MNYRVVLHTLGWVVGFEAVCMVLPLICSLLYHEPLIYVYLISIGLCLLASALLLSVRVRRKSMYAKEGFAIVALSWIVISIFGAVPFFVSGCIPNFANALFETASGFTTTGASVLSDVESVAKSLLFWRSFTHWIGGMGVLVFLVAVLPLAGGSNLYLIKAESPGPSVNKLVPKVGSTAKILYGIYIAFTAVQVVMLLFGGLSLFEALTLSFGTAGTGGFAVKNSSIAEYSPYVQNVITVFMIIFGVDFSLYYLFLMKRFRLALRSEEFRAYLGIIFVSAALICFNCRGLFPTIAHAVRHSMFQVASIITTTGYATCDFDKWPQFSKTILLALMFVGACAGSTGGGMKVSRIIIFLKSIVKEVKIAASPKSTHRIMMNKRPVEHETVRVINVFMMSYLAIFAASILIISADNLDFTTNFTAVATTLNNVGPGFAEVGPTKNFSVYSDLSTLVLTFDMIAGRLEIFPMLILFSPYTWKR